MKPNRHLKRAARALFRFCFLDGALDAERARAVARSLAKSRRRNAVPVLVAFHRLVRLDRDRHTARVESAIALAPPVRDQLQAGLARRYGPALQASFIETPALIGGLRVTIGSDVYDGSVRAKLAALAARL